MNVSLQYINETLGSNYTDKEWDVLLQSGKWVDLSSSALSSLRDSGYIFPPVPLSKLNDVTAQYFCTSRFTIDVDVPIGHTSYINKVLYYQLLNGLSIVKSVSDADIIQSISESSEFELYDFRVYGLLLGLEIHAETELSAGLFGGDIQIFQMTLQWLYEKQNNMPEVHLPLLLTFLRETRGFASVVDLLTEKSLSWLVPWLSPKELDLMWMGYAFSFPESTSVLSVVPAPKAAIMHISLDQEMRMRFEQYVENCEDIHNDDVHSVWMIVEAFYDETFGEKGSSHHENFLFF